MTKKKISDIVLFRISGGWPDGQLQVDERDIWAAIEIKLNAMFNMQQFSITLPSGQTIPENLAIASYPNITVSASSPYTGRSKSVLPITPISLPRNAGIQEVRPVISVKGSDSVLGQPFIPLLQGQEYLLSSDTLLSDIMGQIAYTVNGKTLEYNKDITLLGISKVWMKLVVFDISQYGISDDLPIPSDMVDKLVDELLADFATIAPEQGIVNNFTNAGQTPVPNGLNAK